MYNFVFFFSFFSIGLVNLYTFPNKLNIPPCKLKKEKP